MKLKWRKGRKIYGIGEKSDCAYILISGEVAITMKDEKNVGLIGEDEIFGEQSCLLNVNRTVNAIASKDSIVYKIPKNVLMDEYLKTPVVIQSILRTNYIRLQEMNKNSNIDMKSLVKNLEINDPNT